MSDDDWQACMQGGKPSSDDADPWARVRYSELCALREDSARLRTLAAAVRAYVDEGLLRHRATQPPCVGCALVAELEAVEAP